MIRRSTWIMLVLLVLAIGVAFLAKSQKAKNLAAATPTAGASPLFDAGLGEPTSLRIESSLGVIVEFSRDDSGRWVLKQPEQAPADQASAEAAVTQVGALKTLSTVDLEPEIIGLNKPQYTISVGYGKTSRHVLLVGSVTPIQDGYYCRLDGGPSRVVDKYGLDQLINLLTQPPYLATPAAPASATPVISPTPSTPSSSPGTPSAGGDGSVTTTATP